MPGSLGPRPWKSPLRAAAMYGQPFARTAASLSQPAVGAPCVGLGLKIQCLQVGFSLGLCSEAQGIVCMMSGRTADVPRTGRNAGGKGGRPGVANMNFLATHLRFVFES